MSPKIAGGGRPDASLIARSVGHPSPRAIAAAYFLKRSRMSGSERTETAALRSRSVSPRVDRSTSCRG